MIAIGSLLLADELADVAIAILVSQIPAILSYVVENYDEVKRQVENIISKLV